MVDLTLPRLQLQLEAGPSTVEQTDSKQLSRLLNNCTKCVAMEIIQVTKPELELSSRTGGI